MQSQRVGHDLAHQHVVEHHPSGKKQRGTKDPLDEGEVGE